MKTKKDQQVTREAMVSVYFKFGTCLYQITYVFGIGLFFSITF